ncbi:MAG: alpha/beta fold hydrolase [Dehalococcoidia bacterium]
MKRISLEVDGLQLAAQIHMPGGRGPHPTLCICHGVPAGRTPDPSDGGYPLLAERFCGEGFAVLIFNFRGAGESEGNFDILGWTRDLEAATVYLCQLDEVDKSRLSVMGFSGGAMASIYRAAKDRRISSLVSCACPARFFDIADFSRIEEFLEHCHRIGIIRDRKFPPSLAGWARGFEKVRPIKWVQSISPRPILIVHGDCDQTVDPSHAWDLYHKAKAPKDISIIKGGEHKLRLSEPAMSTALSWLKRVNGLTKES